MRALVLFLGSILSLHAQANSGYYVNLEAFDYASGRTVSVPVYFPRPEVRTYENDIVVLGGNGNISQSGFGCNGRFVIVRNYLRKDGRVFSVIRPQPGADNEFTNACANAGGSIRYGFIVDPSRSFQNKLYWNQLLCSVKLPERLDSELCRK